MVFAKVLAIVMNVVTVFLKVAKGEKRDTIIALMILLANRFLKIRCKYQLFSIAMSSSMMQAEIQVKKHSYRQSIICFNPIILQEEINDM